MPSDRLPLARFMKPDAKTDEVELIYSRRGGIPRERMEQIHAGLKGSISLRDKIPYLRDPLVAPAVVRHHQEAGNYPPFTGLAYA